MRRKGKVKVIINRVIITALRAVIRYTTAFIILFTYGGGGLGIGAVIKYTAVF